MTEKIEPDKGMKAESGAIGIGEQVLDKYARNTADWLLTRGWFIAFLPHFSVIGNNGLAWAIRLLFGGLNLPIGGRIGFWLNTFSDKVASEVAESLGRNPDLLKRDGRLEMTKEEAVENAKDALRGEKFLLLAGMAHASKTCVLLQGMLQKLIRPGRVGKDGKAQPATQTETPMETTLPDILAACVPLCPVCVSATDVRGDGTAPKKTKEPEKSFFDLLKEYEDEDEFGFEVFWANFREADDGVRNKFLRAFGSGGTLADLRRVSARHPDEWEDLLDAKLGIEQHGFVKAIGQAFSKVGRKIADKAGSEQEETAGAFDVVGEAFAGHAKTLDAKADEYAIRNRLRKERHLRAKLAKAKNPEYRRRLQERLDALDPINVTDADVIGEEDANV